MTASSSQQWIVVKDSDNSVATGPSGTEPTPATGQRAVVAPIGYGTNIEWSPERNGFVDLMTEAECLAYVDAAAGALRMTQITAVPGQADIYRRKQAEVDKAGTLGGTLALVLAALNLLSASQRAAQYPLMTVEMEVMGYTTLSQAYQNVMAAITAANTKLNAIEKARRAGKIAVRTATTLHAKNAAARAVAWPT
jgi:hypothetical protein